VSVSARESDLEVASKKASKKLFFTNAMATLLKDDIFGGIGWPNALEGFNGDVLSSLVIGDILLSGDVDVANSVIEGDIVGVPLWLC